MEPAMTYTEIDPRLVREIAEAAIRSDSDGNRAERVEATIIASGMAGPVLGEKFDAYSKAVDAEYDRLAAVASSQEADARAVRAVVDAAGRLPIPQYEGMPELAEALNALLVQFEDRIKVIDAAESLARLRDFRAGLVNERGV